MGCKYLKVTLKVGGADFRIAWVKKDWHRDAIGRPVRGLADSIIVLLHVGQRGASLSGNGDGGRYGMAGMTSSTIITSWGRHQMMRYCEIHKCVIKKLPVCL